MMAIMELSTSPQQSTIGPESTSQNSVTDSRGQSTSVSQQHHVVFDPEEYILRKRLPRQYPKRRNDVYVNMKTDFKSQLERCRKLLFNTGEDNIYIHGLGRAAHRAINLALQLQSENMDALDLAVNTSTLEMVDDFEPENDELEPQTQFRNCSSVHIKVFRKEPLENLSASKLAK